MCRNAAMIINVMQASKKPWEEERHQHLYTHDVMHMFYIRMVKSRSSQLPNNRITAWNSEYPFLPSHSPSLKFSLSIYIYIYNTYIYITQYIIHTQYTVYSIQFMKEKKKDKRKKMKVSWHVIQNSTYLHKL